MPRFSLARALVLATAVLVASGCGGDNDEQPVDVTAACDRLQDLAIAVQSAQTATTAQEVRTAVQEPLAVFVDAADESGDRSLAELAHTYESRFTDYLEAEGIDAREAGNDANIALDRAGARCTELGAANSFPSNS